MTNQSSEYVIVKSPINFVAYAAIGFLLIAAHFVLIVPVVWLDLLIIVLILHFFVSFALRHNSICVEERKKAEGE